MSKLTAETVTNADIRTLTAADGVEQDLGDFATVKELVLFACSVPLDAKSHEIHMVARARAAELLTTRASGKGGE